MNTYRFTELYKGLEATFVVTVSKAMMDKFLEISGDINPLHVDERYANEKGFKGRVVYGLLTSTFYSTLVGVYLPGKFCILQGVDIQFSKPVFVGDELTIVGKIHYINDAYRQLEIKATIINQENIKVSTALIKTGLLDE
jgi:3-hydroxybutyryl-CoA dehydratase